MNRILKLLRDWTLPVAIASGTIIYLIFGFTPALNDFAVKASPFFDTFLPFFMFLILFVTFCKVDFHRMRPVPWIFWTGVFQLIFSAIIVLLVLFFHIRGNSLILMEALLVCISAPAASAAAVVTKKLGGDLEQMTTYTLISNIVTTLIIPVCFPLVDSSIHISFWDAFMKILYEVCVVLLLPMLLAYIVKHTMHRFHQWVVGVKDLSYYLWGVSLMIVSGTTVRNICHSGAPITFLLTIALLSLIVCICQFGVGRFVGHFFHHALEAGQGLGQKNTAFAIWIGNAFLDPLSTLGPGCYILWQNLINSLEIWHYRKMGKEQSA